MTPPAVPGPTESALRERLGIPPEARRVLVFVESSHWDTNWLRTSEEYYRDRIEPILLAVLAELERDPGRVYCVESVFFLRLFWERRPELRDRVRALVERRQLRLGSASLTTPDTLLPGAEAVLRDYALGQAWLRANRLPAEPRTALFPDNFGHSPHVPSLMRAVGVDAVALTRIDGMYFVAADYRPRGAFPLPGSSAALLQNELKTLDFVWRADDGAEVLCHWNAFTYFHGDMLAHAGIVRWAGHVVGVPWRSAGHVARRVDGYVRELEPVSRTPYLLCAIGMDFNDPIRDLRPLLERYNRARYARTGTWTVLAGIDDYFALVGCRRDALPVLELDPNPYWMGFGASRPEVKQRPARIGRTLLLAERASAMRARDEALETALRKGWSTLVLSNHHDYITGTSPDRVWAAEQKPWLDEAEAAAEQALALCAVPPDAEPARAGPSGVRVVREGPVVRVDSGACRFVLSEEQGGCLTSLVVDGREVLAGLGFDLVRYADEGGLWRLGHEFRGGRFEEVDRASRRPARVEASEVDGETVLAIACDFGGKPFTRTLRCRAGEPYLLLSVCGAAPRRATVTCRFELASGCAAVEMDTVGGTVSRPRERLYSPTFWPVPSSLSLREEGRALHACFEAPTAVSFDRRGSLEWIVARNAVKERAFRLLPVLAHPIGGTVDQVVTHRGALFGGRDDQRASVRRRIHDEWLPPAHRAVRRAADAVVRCDDASVDVCAVKRADDGDGVVVRLACERPPARPVRLGLGAGRLVEARRCDALERDLGPVEIVGEWAEVPLAGRLTTVRLRTRP